MILSPEVLDVRESQRLRHIQRTAGGRADFFSRGLSELHDLPYRNDHDPRHTLDLIRPEATGEKLPVIIEIHGGGYTACGKEINLLHARAFAHLGFSVVNGEYSLHPEVDFDAELGELADLVGWTSTHAEEHGIDPTRIFMSGDSAGGHLVLLYLALQSDPSLAQQLGVSPSQAKIRAAAVTCPLCRLEGEGNVQPVLESFVRMMYPGGTTKEYLKQFDILRLFQQIHCPPVMVITTPGDILFHKESLLLKRALEEQNLNHDFRVYESEGNTLGHVFNVLYPEYAESMKANRDIADFFLSHAKQDDSP